jgi:prepilin-type N-terminal cleavage/methylation domain-containing protein
MNRRSGFTLFEVMVAIVITGVVALLVFGTAQAGFDTRDRLERFRTQVEGQAILRALLVDALRHPVEGGGFAMNDTLFLIEDAVRADGLPMDALRFHSRGVMSPQGATTPWSVLLLPEDGGLRLIAIPADTNVASIDALMPTTRGIDVRVLTRTADSVWNEQWDGIGRVPAAVAIDFYADDGSRIGPPLVVHSALEVVR